MADQDQLQTRENSVENSSGNSVELSGEEDWFYYNWNVYKLY